VDGLSIWHKLNKQFKDSLPWSWWVSIESSQVSPAAIVFDLLSLLLAPTMASNPFIWLRIAHMIVALENWMILLVSFLATWRAEYHICGRKLQVPQNLHLSFICHHSSRHTSFSSFHCT
jgi:hypothetical protein